MPWHRSGGQAVLNCDSAFFNDDRRLCRDCGWLSGMKCLAAPKGLLPTMFKKPRPYQPVTTVLMRCEAFKVKGDKNVR